MSIATGASFAGGAQVIADLCLTGLPDAIFFGNDALAAGALMECLRRKINIPKDLVIFGFADLDIAQAIHPKLSSVHVPTSLMGKGAASMLLARLDSTWPAGNTSSKIQDLGFELVLRDSA